MAMACGDGSKGSGSSDSTEADSSCFTDYECPEGNTVDLLIGPSQLRAVVRRSNPKVDPVPPVLSAAQIFSV